MLQHEYAQHVFALLADGLRGGGGDMRAFVDEFTDDATLWLPPAPDTSSPYRGRKAIRALLVDAMLPRYQDGLQLTLYGLLETTGRALYQFEDSAVQRDGTKYQGSPCIALGFDGSQIVSFHQYWGAPGFFAPCLDPAATRDGVDTTARDIAIAAFAELQQGLMGDRAAMDAFLGRFADNARLWFPPTPNTQSPYVGPAAAATLFREVLVPMYPQGLRTTVYHTLAAGTRTAFELQSSGQRADGSVYINSPCLCLDIRAGRIRTLWEHWGGPGYFAPVS